MNVITDIEQEIDPRKRLEVERTLARADPYYFTRYMFKARRKFLWQRAQHHVLICKALKRVYLGETSRLIINVAPRYSKTELAVVNFMAWGLGLSPDAEFIHTCYSADLATNNAYATRELVMTPEYKLFFPDVVLKTDSAAKDEWKTTAGGVVYAVGARGTITGYGAGKMRPGFGGAIIIDDPHKANEASSDVIRPAVIEWFHNTIMNRRNSRHTPIILIMQRLHEDDLAGHLLNGGTGEQWEHINIKTLQDDGTALWPEKHSVEDLKLMEETSPWTFASQFQQHPVPPTGGIFKPDMIEIIDVLPKKMRLNVRGWDLAATQDDGDWTAGLHLGQTYDNKHIIIDARRLQGSPDKVEAAIVNTAKQDGGMTRVSIPQDPGQAGKPIWEEEPVLMASGATKRLADVVIGDFVIGKDGKAHRVEHVWKQGELDCLKLTTETGREIIAAPDHPFLTPDGWIEAGALEVGMSLALMTRPVIDASCTRSNEEFRLAGYFIGDAAVGRASDVGDTGSCHAEFTCNDDVQMQDFTHCVEFLGGAVVQRAKKIQYGTKRLQQWLRDTDIAGHTAYTNEVPAWIKEASPDQVANFLGAYFACDGTISKHGDEVVFYSVSRKLLHDVQHLLLRLGISSTLKQKTGKYLEKRHVSWLLRLRQQDDAYGRFVRRVPIYHSFKLGRLKTTLEKARFRRFDEEYLPDRIVSIEPVGKVLCRCLSVPDVESFVVRDIVVHNSQVAYLTRALSGFRVLASPESGDKVTRAEPFASQVNVGNVQMLRGDWNAAFLHELRNFPFGKNDDQVDAASRAFNAINEMSSYDSSLSWVGTL